MISQNIDVFDDHEKVETIKNNELIAIKEGSLEIKRTTLVKKFEVSRKPKPGYESIFEEEIHESVQAVGAATGDGEKFETSSSVLLGGMMSDVEDQMLIENLVIAATGSTLIASEYGAYIINELKCFNTV